MKTKLLLKKGILPLILVLILLPAGLCSCGSKKDVPAVHLAQELSTERVEWTTLPWFSEVSLALEKFGVSPNHCTVKVIEWTNGKTGYWGFQMGFPVHWTDMDQDAALLLTYRYPGGVDEEGIPLTSLHRVSLTLYFPDGQAKADCVANTSAMLKSLAEKEPAYPLPDTYKYLNQQNEDLFTEKDLGAIGTGIAADGYAYEMYSSIARGTDGAGCSEGLRLTLAATPQEELRPSPDTPYGVIGWD